MKWRTQLTVKGGDRNYTGLLIVIFLTFFTPTLLNATVLRIGIAVLYLSFNMLILQDILTSKINLKILRSLAISFFVFDIFIVTTNSIHERYFIIASSLFQVCFIGVSIWVINQDLIQRKKVTREVLQGAICVYLMIGFLWGILYKMIYLFDASAFSNISPENYIRKLNYYSFITLTTVGYGDITPQNSLAMSLANIEAIIGQLFPAIIIARLVSLYEAEKKED
jgi:Ion channel